MAWPQARHFNGKKVRRSHSRNWKRGECYSLAWEKYKYKNDFIIKVRLRPPAWGTTGGKSVAQACYRKVEIPQLSPFLQASEHGMGLWWLILCVYLARPWCPDTWSNTILDVSLKGAFFFFFEQINIWICGFWVKQLILILWVGLIWSVDGLPRAKADLPKQGGILQQTALDLNWSISASIMWFLWRCHDWPALGQVLIRRFWGHRGMNRRAWWRPHLTPAFRSGISSS